LVYVLDRFDGDVLVLIRGALWDADDDGRVLVGAREQVHLEGVKEYRESKDDM
jgi:hypothetical protein